MNENKLRAISMHIRFARLLCEDIQYMQLHHVCEVLHDSFSWNTNAFDSWHQSNIKIEILPLLDFRDLLFSTKTKVKIITRVKAMTLDNKHILGSGLLGECEMGWGGEIHGFRLIQAHFHADLLGGREDFSVWWLRVNMAIYIAMLTCQFFAYFPFVAIYAYFLWF